MTRKCEIHVLNSFHSPINLKIYCNFDLNHLVAYFPFGNIYTFCMHGLTRKQPIKTLVLGDVISVSFLPERSWNFCNILHYWKEDKFLYTMIYGLTIFSFNYHDYTGIYDKMHGLTRKVDIHERENFCMNYDGKYYSHTVWAPRMCHFSSIYENWYSQTFLMWLLKRRR